MRAEKKKPWGNKFAGQENNGAHSHPLSHIHTHTHPHYAWINYSGLLTQFLLPLLQYHLLSKPQPAALQSRTTACGAQAAWLEREGGGVGGGLQPADPSFTKPRVLLTFLCFPSISRECAQSSFPLFISLESDRSCGPFSPRLNEDYYCLVVCSPTGRCCCRLHCYLYSPVKLWKRAPTEPAMGAVRCRPHAALKAQGHNSPSLPPAGLIVLSRCSWFAKRRWRKPQCGDSLTGAWGWFTPSRLTAHGVQFYRMEMCGIFNSLHSLHFKNRGRAHVATKYRPSLGRPSKLFPFLSLLHRFTLFCCFFFTAIS